MTFRDAHHAAFLFLCIFVPLSRPEARTRPAATLDSRYVSALAAADHFLQAWQAGDVENGMVLLSTHAKESATAEAVQAFFSDPETLAYEITHGKLLKRDRYEFSVIFLTRSNGSRNTHARRRFASIVVVNTGNNDWLVDKLP